MAGQCIPNISTISALQARSGVHLSGRSSHPGPIHSAMAALSPATSTYSMPTGDALCSAGNCSHAERSHLEYAAPHTRCPPATPSAPLGTAMHASSIERSTCQILQVCVSLETLGSRDLGVSRCSGPYRCHSQIPLPPCSQPGATAMDSRRHVCSCAVCMACQVVG